MVSRRDKLVFAVYLAVIGLLLFSGCWRRPKGGGEAAAISALRTISSAEELYNTRYESYETLEELGKANLLDSVLAAATHHGASKSGYYFVLTLNADKSAWTCVTRPAEWDVTGTRNFKIDQTGVIYYNSDKNSSDWQKALGG